VRKNKKTVITIKDVVDKLKENHYTVVKSERKLYDFYRISGYGIRGGFCTQHDNTNDDLLNHSNSWLNGYVVIDNKNCFDKWSKCPLWIPIPETKQELDFLIERLKFWGSEEGFKASDEYNTDLWDNINWD